jgi:hypothetical protein
MHSIKSKITNILLRQSYVNNTAEDTIVGLKSEEVSYIFFRKINNGVGNIITFLGCDLL